ncbi:hypothetical protein PIB30_109428 [Stylosanthes scabra]|uniref:Uncharacterized protein n=1 Tax=Stylosanthes scabra TaxID=79078 RepID=A0ABU6XZ70_9FABA|nr:hypothetical protein [Stylosanthes scabra]
MRTFLRICVGLSPIDHSFPKYSLSPRICVQSDAYAWHTHSQSPLKTHSTNPSHVLSPYHPRICVQPYAYAWNSHHSSHPTSPLPFPHPPTHMRAILRICVGTIFALNVTSPHDTKQALLKVTQEHTMSRLAKLHA